MGKYTSHNAAEWKDNKLGHNLLYMTNEIFTKSKKNSYRQYTDACTNNKNQAIIFVEVKTLLTIHYIPTHSLSRKIMFILDV
jgi:hypothetical protein